MNQEKDNQTAYDYVSGKGGEAGLQEYLERVEDLFKGGYINKAKYNKLRMTGKIFQMILLIGICVILSI